MTYRQTFFLYELCKICVYVIWTKYICLYRVQTKLLFSIPDIDKFSTYHIDKLSICRIYNLSWSVRHIDNLYICCIDKLYLSGIY